MLLRMMLVALLVLSAATVYAQTPDGETPAEEDACNGLFGAAFGLCNAYCEAMDCDSSAPQASGNACAKVFDKFAQITGVAPPCETICPCLVDPDVDLSTYFVGAGDLRCRYQTLGRIDLRDPSYGGDDYQLGAGLVLASGLYFCEANNVAQGIYSGDDPYNQDLPEAEAMACYEVIEQLASVLGVPCDSPPF